MNATDTASAAGSLLIDLQVGGVSQFKVSKAGAVTAVGVEIPTISSTSTLTNKTLSSPTLSNPTINGTVAGEPTWSGTQTFGAGSGQVTTNINGGSSGTGGGPRLVFQQGGSFRNAIGHKSAIAGGAFDDTLYIYSPVALQLDPASGVTVGAATGGAQGAGTINATAVYDDGVLLTCYVLEHWLDGVINIEAWDARVPDREVPAVVVDGEETELANTEVRQHWPARNFAQVADARLDIDQFRQFLSNNRRLPAFPGPDRWADMFSGKMSTGDVLQRLWETVEVLAVHACKAREREITLEARIAALENV
jgi:hypothetical protein